MRHPLAPDRCLPQPGQPRQQFLPRHVSTSADNLPHVVRDRFVAGVRLSPV